MNSDILIRNILWNFVGMKDLLGIYNPLGYFTMYDKILSRVVNPLTQSGGVGGEGEMDGVTEFNKNSSQKIYVYILVMNRFG